MATGRTVGSLALASGSTQISTSSSKYLVRLFTRLLGKSLSKAIPLVGAVTGFVVNYLLTLTVGRSAIRFYAGLHARKKSLPTQTS